MLCMRVLNVVFLLVLLFFFFPRTLQRQRGIFLIKLRLLASCLIAFPIHVWIRANECKWHNSPSSTGIINRINRIKGVVNKVQYQFAHIKFFLF